MSKLDTLASKIAEKMMPKMRRMVREELDYALDKMGDKKVIHDTGESQSKRRSKSKSGNSSEGDYSQVAESFKGKFHQINGDTVVDPNEQFEDESGKVHRMGDLMQNEGAQKVMEKVNRDYSHLID